ncbi:hypothetical protein CHS0354_008844 [Potamilus streckersoni]|uniref:Uncharacterized protein n=1 Tax=Potamilus streckersoni TaxID=2493646 RepID=A0AAE0W1Y7_9BIVA|nr:hypothetical protein CHS0354_008844 [Potamilus streckersoni]
MMVDCCYTFFWSGKYKKKSQRQRSRLAMRTSIAGILDQNHTPTSDRVVMIFENATQVVNVYWIYARKMALSSPVLFSNTRNTSRLLGNTHNQNTSISWIMGSQNRTPERDVLNTRVMRGAFCSTDHQMLRSTMKISVSTIELPPKMMQLDLKDVTIIEKLENEIEGALIEEN